MDVDTAASSSSIATNNLPQGLTLKLVASEKDCDYNLITTVKLRILNGRKEKVGDMQAWLIPKEVGQTVDYFDALDAIDQELCEFAAKCVDDEGLLRDNVCTYHRNRHWYPADSRQIAYLDEVVVNEPLRRRGIGTWAVNAFMEKYKKRINMIVTRPSLLASCDPLLGRDHSGPKPTEEEKTAYYARLEGVVQFFSKIGFRRLGTTEFIALAKDPNHPSRSIAAKNDAPYQAAPAQLPTNQQELIRYILSTSRQPGAIDMINAMNAMNAQRSV